MKKNDFFDQYKDPRWQKKRLEIMERDEFMCQVCGDDRVQLNVHHRIYFKDTKIWEYSDEFLVTLCESCHERSHEARAQINLLLARIDESFLSDYCCIIDTLRRFNPREISDIDEFLQRMFPLKKCNPDAESDF